MSLPTTYKLKSDLQNIDTCLLNCVWEEAPLETVPNCVYVPPEMCQLLEIEKGGFKECQAKKEEISFSMTRAYEANDFNSVVKKHYRWALQIKLLDTHMQLWQSAQILYTELSSDLIILQTPNMEHHLLIEKRNVEETRDKSIYISNKYNLPLTRCCIVKKTYPQIFGDRQMVDIFDCKTHKYGMGLHHSSESRGFGDVQEDPLICNLVVPNNYRPCDKENDQGGPYCHTHGHGDFEDYYNDYCSEYKGPLIEVDCEYEGKIKNIPKDYKDCRFSNYDETRTCYTHDGKRVNKLYCDKYEGPTKTVLEATKERRV